MSRDPYLDVKGDYESNLSHAESLFQSYSRLSASSSTPSSSTEAQQTRLELRDALSSLEADLEDLEESVKAVENAGDRWGVSEGEVKARRRFLDRAKGQVEDLRQKVNGPNGKGKGKGRGDTHPNNAHERYRDLPDEEDRIGNEDPEEVRRWEMEEQQVMMRKQDDTLGYISGTLSTLASQAGLIGQEVGEQNEMLDDLGNRVDHTDTRLRKVTRTLNDFIRKNEDTKSSWCIGILIVVLIILLVLVILT